MTTIHDIQPTADIDQPATTTAPPRPRRPRQQQLPVDDATKKAFIQAYIDTDGDLEFAFCTARPHCQAADRPGRGSIRFALENDPEFAEQLQQAKNQIRGKLTELAIKRSETPEIIPVFSNGVKVGERVVWRDANVVLLRRLSRLDRSWCAQLSTNVTGTVNVEHRLADGSVTLAADDIMLLGDGEREDFLELLGLINARRKEQQHVHEQHTAEPQRLLAGGESEIEAGD